ncbi:MAG: hypothetical protein ACYDD1_10385, partial [Caulobacteraceae bacterium]
MSKTAEEGSTAHRVGVNAPRTRHGRNRTTVVQNWSLISDEIADGIPLSFIWRHLREADPRIDISYPAFRSHVKSYGELVAKRGASSSSNMSALPLAETPAITKNSGSTQPQETLAPAPAEAP